ncbi:hypothetical protein D3C73_699630 [compost metagenome]
MTTYICDVCNGMKSLASNCPACNHLAEDQGKLSDFYGPYSPYRPIDELKASNGFEDLSSHRCIHVACCSNCNYSFPVSIQEQMQFDK